MALLRRLEKRILVTLPNAEAREGMIKRNLDQIAMGDLNIASFAEMLEVSFNLVQFYRVTVVVI